MVSQLGRHGGFDLAVSATGDLDVDAHHTVEDVGIALGEVLAEALGDKAGVRRFALGVPPARRGAGRGGPRPVGPALPRLRHRASPAETTALGTPPFDPQLAEEFWRAFVTAAGITLHVRLVDRQEHPPHRGGLLQGVARALRDAVRVEGGGIPSTKGTL